ncbi:phage tail protein [Lacticaseibacillus absianus]|uniref:phage tail tube protein n=1 Tax=Lacticaseibacillus absianus TaxID=2729623 RepID=UPI0015CCAC07|nr:phage tail protein [Lacticaseibacillus absianus]
MSDAKNVSTAKPKVGGAIYSAPLGTTLPTDAVSELSAEFKSLGYVSDDGLTNKNTPSSDKITAWGGDTVAVVQKEKTDEFTYTLIEALNVDVLKEVYGPDNVIGTLDTGITIKANNATLPAHVLVVDVILQGGVLKRIVIPSGQVSELGEVKYGDEDAVGYETTLAALPDGSGNSHYEYIGKPTPATNTGD